MRTLVLNSNNVVKDGQNNKLVYNFPNSVKFDKTYLSVASVSMYYAWFNITSAYGNNTFTFSWTSTLTSPNLTTYTLTLPDGLYEVATINQYLQFICIQNGLYLISPSGQNVYFAEFVINESQYKVQINTFYVPTSLPAGYTQPTNFAGYPPTNTLSPTITISTGLGAILGFTTTASQTIGGLSTLTTTLALTSAVVALSPTSPNLQPNSSVLISSSMIDNPYTSPTSIIYSITPSVAVGEIIAEKPPSFMWNKLIDGVYNQLRITLLGTDLAPLKIQDGAITIILAIADEDEVKNK